MQKIFDVRTTDAHRSVYDAATMERMTWTDDRLQERFDSIDHRFDEADRRFDKIDTELGRINDRLDGLHHVLMQVGAAIFVALLGLIATQL